MAEEPSRLDDETDDQLIARAIASWAGSGSSMGPLAWEILRHRYGDLVVAHARSRTKDEGKVERFEQYFWNDGWRLGKFRTYEVGRNFPAYFRTVVSTMWIDFLRRSANRPGEVQVEFGDPGRDSGPSDRPILDPPARPPVDPERTEAGLAYHECVEALPERYRRIWKARFPEAFLASPDGQREEEVDLAKEAWTRATGGNRSQEEAAWKDGDGDEQVLVPYRHIEELLGIDPSHAAVCVYRAKAMVERCLEGKGVAL